MRPLVLLLLVLLSGCAASPSLYLTAPDGDGVEAGGQLSITWQGEGP